MRRICQRRFRNQSGVTRADANRNSSRTLPGHRPWWTRALLWHRFLIWSLHRLAVTTGLTLASDSGTALCPSHFATQYFIARFLQAYFSHPFFTSTFSQRRPSSPSLPPSTFTLYDAHIQDNFRFHCHPCSRRLRQSQAQDTQNHGWRCSGIGLYPKQSLRQARRHRRMAFHVQEPHRNLECV